MRFPLLPMPVGLYFGLLVFRPQRRQDKLTRNNRLKRKYEIFRLYVMTILNAKTGKELIPVGELRKLQKLH